MRYAHIIVLFSIAILCQTAWSDPCYVTTAAEFQTALNNIANQTGCDTCGDSGQNYCPQIIVDTGETIVINSGWLSIGQGHEYLQLTINGTIEWGGGNCDNCKMLQLSDATHVTISGTGKFMVPSDIVFPNPDDPLQGVPVAIKIVGDCSDIEIDGLEFENVSYMINQENGDSDNLTFTNLTGTKLWEYGIFTSDVDGMTIDDCHVGVDQGAIGTYRYHGLRLYGDNITVTDCSAYNTGAYGLWRVDGDNATIDGFTSNENIRLGPNHSCVGGAGVDTGQRTHRLIAKNITTTGNVEVQNGTIGCYLENITSSQISIGNGNGFNIVPRPVNRVLWKDTSATPSPAETPGTGCIGIELGEFTCFGDINSDDQVNVNDLLAVINNWGACEAWDEALGGTCEDLPPCILPCLA